MQCGNFKQIRKFQGQLEDYQGSLNVDDLRIFGSYSMPRIYFQIQGFSTLSSFKTTQVGLHLHAQVHAHETLCRYETLQTRCRFLSRFSLNNKQAFLESMLDL